MAPYCALRNARNEFRLPHTLLVALPHASLTTLDASSRRLPARLGSLQQQGDKPRPTTREQGQACFQACRSHARRATLALRGAAASTSVRLGPLHGPVPPFSAAPWRSTTRCREVGCPQARAVGRREWVALRRITCTVVWVCLGQRPSAIPAIQSIRRFIWAAPRHAPSPWLWGRQGSLPTQPWPNLEAQPWAQPWSQPWAQPWVQRAPSFAGRERLPCLGREERWAGRSGNSRTAAHTRAAVAGNYCAELVAVARVL
jgi:hypothetical protein